MLVYSACLSVGWNHLLLDNGASANAIKDAIITQENQKIAQMISRKLSVHSLNPFVDIDKWNVQSYLNKARVERFSLVV